MKIYIERISAEGIDLEEVIPASRMDLMVADEGTRMLGDGVHVKVHVTLIGNELVVQGWWQAKFELECSRCLRFFTQELKNEEAFYEYRITNEDTIDLTQEIREDIILLFPIKPLCSENCPGLCPVCGRLRGTDDCVCPQPEPDPRLSVLDELRKKLGSEESPKGGKDRG